jgi:putative redox protein
MVTMQLEYQGDLHCKAIHEPSGTELTTDAPKDNQGRGESFSPTDLVATALGSCMLTVMGIMARTSISTSLEPPQPSAKR